MIVVKGVDFPQEVDAALRTYGESMWYFREQPDTATTRALISYAGDHRECVVYAFSSDSFLDMRIRIPLQVFNTSPLGYV
jgi:hypothetical protein